MNLPALRVLLVEDNEDDVLLVEDASARCGVPVELTVVGSVDRALELLAEESRRLRLELVLLDLNLPGRDGFELLDALQGLRGGRAVPPVVLVTTSKRPGDAARAREMGARDFLSKPVGLPEFREALGGLLQDWFRRLRGVRVEDRGGSL